MNNLFTQNPQRFPVAENMENSEPIVDYAYFDEITGGDDDLKNELIQMFETETEDQLERIRTASRTNDLDTLKQAIHKYRSSLFSVGLLNTANKYKEIETRLKSNEVVPNIGEVLFNLEMESQRGLELLKNV